MKVKSNSITLGICQLPVTSDKSLNIRNAEKMLKAAAEKKCKIAILPEMFNCPYDAKFFSEYAESYPKGETFTMLSQTAAQEHMVVVGGSVPERDEYGNIFNTSFIFDERGDLLERHRKVHLFDVEIAGGTVFKESSILSAGQDITVVKAAGLMLGIGICYDIRFPELSRLMTLAGAKLLIFPGVFGMTTGPAHWELLMRARAVDNQVFVAGAAPANFRESSYQVYGHSMVVNPWGQIVSAAGDKEELLIVEIDLEILNTVRRELPLLQHRRADVYELCQKKGETTFV
ncbi:carbon-nitrogen hydrolase family protein [Pelosinus propionicus]|uniref:carbon-nitrogen hydrolase family protein n=1 Tax=Pelosinus propionicus TaxID=380084 RepID=UPI001FE1A6DE|nr:carbon-nitrogen hydrolase family protein [Pelosinus propionicus]